MCVRTTANNLVNVFRTDPVHYVPPQAKNLPKLKINDPLVEGQGYYFDDPAVS